LEAQDSRLRRRLNVAGARLDRVYNNMPYLYNRRQNKMANSAADRDQKALSASRNRATLERARAAGLLGASKDARIAGRVSSELVAAAKKRTGMTSDTDVIEIALATLALEDDFGAKLVRRKGSVPRDIDLEL
jgi:hypothetical protein